MRITSRCYSRPISASAQLEVPPIHGDVSRVACGFPACRVQTVVCMISWVTMIINSPNWPEIPWIRGILRQGMVVARQATATYIEVVVQWRHIIFIWYGTRTVFFTCTRLLYSQFFGWFWLQGQCFRYNLFYVIRMYTKSSSFPALSYWNVCIIIMHKLPAGILYDYECL